MLLYFISWHTPDCLVKRSAEQLAVVSGKVDTGYSFAVSFLKFTQTLSRQKLPHLKIEVRFLSVKSNTENVRSGSENVRSNTENVWSNIQNARSGSENVRSDTDSMTTRKSVRILPLSDLNCSQKKM